MRYQCEDEDEDIFKDTRPMHGVYFKMGDIEIDISTPAEKRSLDDVLLQATNAIKLLHALSNDAEADSGGTPPDPIPAISDIKIDGDVNVPSEIKRVHLMQKYHR